MENYSKEIWVLKTKEEIIEYYAMLILMMPQAVGWADKKVVKFPAKIKSGYDIYCEACDLMTMEIILGKLKVFKNYYFMKKTLYNFMNRIISRYIKEEKRIKRQHEYETDFQYEAAINMAVIKGWCASPVETEENERYYQQLFKEFIETLTGIKKEIFQVSLSDENDFRRMLYPVAGALTDELILELLKKNYIDQNGDTAFKFKRDKPPASLRLSSQFKPFRKKIHRILKANRIITSRSLMASYLGITLKEVVDYCEELGSDFKRFKKRFDERYFEDNP